MISFGVVVSWMVASKLVSWMWSSLLELVNVALFNESGVSLYTLAYDTLRGAMTVPRLTIKGPKVDGGPVPGNLPTLSPRELEQSSYSLAYEITQPRDFPAGPVINKTQHFHCWEHVFDP